MPRRRPLTDPVVAGLFALTLAAWACWPLPLHPAATTLGEKGVNAWAILAWLLDAPPGEWWAGTMSWLNPQVAVQTVPVALPQALLARLFAQAASTGVAISASLFLHVAAGIFGWTLVARRLLPADGGAAALAASLASGGAAGLSCVELSAIGNGQPENLGLGWLALVAGGGILLAAGRTVAGVGTVVLGAIGAWLSSPYLLMGPLIGAPIALVPTLRRHGRAVAIAATLLTMVSIPMVGHFQGTADSGTDRGLCPASLDRDPAPQRRAALPGDVGVLLRGTPPTGRELLVADPAALLRPGRRPSGDDHLPLDYLGWLPVGAALLSARRDRRSRWLLSAAALPLVLAFGPVLFFNGWALTTPGGSLLPGPLALLQALPVVGGLFATVQVPGRLLFGTSIFLALAGAPAWLRLARHLRATPRAPLLLALLAVAPAAEQLLVGPSAPPMPASSILPAEAHRALAAFDDDRGLLEVPPLGWDPDRPAMIDADGVIVSPPVRFQRGLHRGWPVHRHTLATEPCPDGHVLIPDVDDSAFARSVTDLLAGDRPSASLDATAPSVTALGYGWLIVHTGSGLIRPDAEQRLLSAARRELTLVAEGEDGSYLFRLPEPSP